MTAASRVRSGLNAQFLLPTLALTLTLGALLALPLYSAATVASFDGYNILQNFAALGLVALGVGLTMLAGELDLSSAAMYALAGMLAAKVGQESPLVGIGIAVAVPALLGACQGLVVARMRISSVPITIAGFFVVAGAVGALGDDKSVPFQDFTFGLRLDEPVMTLFSVRSLVVLGLFVFVALFMTLTRVGRDIRAVGSDRDAARMSGVRVDAVLVSLFAASGALSALGGVLLANSLGVAQAAVTVNPLIFGVTAALVGGVTLSGGRGDAFGIAAGALSLAALQQVFALLATPSYVQNLAFGALLLLAVVSDASGLRERILGAHAQARLRRKRLNAPAGVTTSAVSHR